MTPKRAESPIARPDARESLDIARYVTDMTAQLEAMAVAARLDLLAYFLGMAKAESELYVRSNVVDGENMEEIAEDDSSSADPENGDDIPLGGDVV